LHLATSIDITIQQLCYCTMTYSIKVHGVIE
jgi:hypothetical protein